VYPPSVFKKRKKSRGRTVKTPDIWKREDSNSIFSVNKENNYENIVVNIDDLTVIIDRLILRPNGLFLIVNKNRSGRIVGNEKEDQWAQYKINPINGVTTEKTLRNPIKQTKLHSLKNPSKRQPP